MTSVVGEIGINHNGSIEIACAMASMLRDAGCDYAKIQLREISWAYSPEELAKPCESPWGTTIEDKVRGRELSWAAVDTFNAHCRQINLPWFASCFDLESLKQLHTRYPTRPYNKVPSVLATRREFLEAVAFQGVPTLVSTGHFPTAYDAAWLISDVFSQFNCPYGLLHTTALYPAPIERLNLRRMQKLDEMVRMLADDGQANLSLYLGVGYSGHETGVSTSVVAAALGACWIERHVTLDRASYGADQAASLEPEGVRRLVRDVKAVSAALGQADPVLVGDEKVPVSFWREE